MSVLSNLHAHTLYSDGQSTIDEMIEAAIAKGFISVGISDHAYAPYDIECCIPANKMTAYRGELYAAKKKYAGQIQVWAGLEMDAFCPHIKENWDYVIGSVHCVKTKTGAFLSLDDTAEKYAAAVEAFGGIRPMAEEYIAQVVALAEGYRPDILGHLDILSKLPRMGLAALPEHEPWYRKLWEAAVPRIAHSGCVVEVNTQAIYRGHSAEPYPRRFLLELLCRHYVPVTLASDAHSADMLDGGFDGATRLLKDVGYRSVAVLRDTGFEEIDI